MLLITYLVNRSKEELTKYAFHRNLKEANSKDGN